MSVFLFIFFQWRQWWMNELYMTKWIYLNIFDSVIWRYSTSVYWPDVKHFITFMQKASITHRRGIAVEPERLYVPVVFHAGWNIWGMWTLDRISPFKCWHLTSVDHFKGQILQPGHETWRPDSWCEAALCLWVSDETEEEGLLSHSHSFLPHKMSVPSMLLFCVSMFFFLPSFYETLFNHQANVTPRLKVKFLLDLTPFNFSLLHQSIRCQCEAFESDGLYWWISEWGKHDEKKEGDCEI